MAAFSPMVTAMPHDQLLSGLESTRATVRPCDEAIGSSCCVTIVQDRAIRLGSTRRCMEAHFTKPPRSGRPRVEGIRRGGPIQLFCAELNRGPVPD